MANLLAARFFLRKGVKFHSGNPFTAQDVVWTFNRLKKSVDFKGLFEPFLRAEYIDDHTVDIITERPYPLMLNMVTYIFPMDSKFYSGKDENGQPKDAIIKHGNFWRQDFTIEPRLAERWERKDVNRVRFFLRKGVKFHSGNPFTAQDVVWTFNRLKKSVDFKGLFEPFLRAEYIDDHTVDIITERPYPLMLNMVTYIFPMDSKFYSGKDENGQPKDAIIKHGKSFASTNVSGTGPFILQSREQGVRLIFKRNPGYWDKTTKGNVTDIVFTPIKEGPTRVAALLSGELDFIAPVPPTDLFRINRDKANNLIGMRGTRVIILHMDQKRRKEFQDKRVRQAIVHAINNVGIAKKIMRGFATPAAQLSPPEFQGHNKSLKPRFDLAKAKRLMKEAGYGQGFSITMMAPNNRYVNDFKIARAVAGMLAKINIKVELKTLPKAQYWQKFDERALDKVSPSP